MESFLLGHFTGMQCRGVSLARIHQAAVIIVRVRFDASDVEFAITPIVTVLYTRQIDQMCNLLPWIVTVLYNY